MTARVAIAVAAVVVLLAGAGFLVRHVTGTPQRQHAGRAAPAASTESSPAASPRAVSPPPPGRAGDYHVAEHWFTFTEPAAAAGGTRILQVQVRYPVTAQSAAASGTGAGEFPLIVFAPGYRQCGAVYSDLLTEWASAGYVVAVVNFPMTNCHTASPEESDLIHQPQDVAAVIGRLDAMSEQGQVPLAGLIDTSRVAVAGHSDGGDTVAAMAATSCCRYPGLRAVIVLAGAEWPAFPGRWFSAPTPPMLFVQGTADSWNPPAASEQLYQSDSSGPRYYLDLFGADHFAPYEGEGPPEPIVAQVTIEFLDQFLAGSGDETRAMQAAGNVGGVARFTGSGPLP